MRRQLSRILRARPGPGLPRVLSTLSPLGTAFNTRPPHRINIAFKESSGLFGVEELRSYDGFHQLKEDVETHTAKLVTEASCPSRRRKIVEVFDELSDTLCRVADLAEFVRLAHPKQTFAQAAEDACISISGIVEKLNTNRELYLSLKEVVEKGDKLPTTEVEDHVSSLFLFDFEQCGIHLEEEKRRQVVHLNDFILQVGQRFMAGSIQPRAVPKSRIPSSVSTMFNREYNSVVVGGLFSDSSDEQVRETAYRIYLEPDADQEKLLDSLLQARYHLAHTCDFPTYAHRALKSSLAETPEMVGEFLDLLTDKLRPKAEAEFKMLQKMKSSSQPLSAWDVPYLSSKARSEWLRTGNSQYSAYFSLGACMDGLNLIMESLFDITFKNAPIRPGEVWAPDIYKLSVEHKTEGLLGYIYCDFYERSSKPNQDCHFTIRGGRLLPDGSYQDPVVVVMLNLGGGGGPILLSPSMVDNLFHEMGHAMHSMLARTTHQHVTGTRCSTDFAEVPSVLMEYFASDPRVVKSFARHYETGEKMPDELVNRLCKSKQMFPASEMQLQVFYSKLDQVYHSSNHPPPSGKTTSLLAKTQANYYSIPYVENTAWQLRFSHLVGYGAKYYSYLMSKAVASWIWQSYFMESPLSRSAGEQYRQGCLSHGGGKPPKSLVADFLRLDPSPSSLANALINDLNLSNKI